MDTNGWRKLIGERKLTEEEIVEYEKFVMTEIRAEGRRGEFHDTSDVCMDCGRIYCVCDEGDLNAH